MPTIKPRVAITLEPHTHEVISRLAKLQGVSRGAVIVDLLESVEPALARTFALLEAASRAPDQVKQGLRSVVEGVHDELVSVSGDGIKQMDWLLERLSGGSAEGPTPVPVTRGSGMDSNPPKKPQKQRAKRSSPGVPGE
jgi:hypothetical protein